MLRYLLPAAVFAALVVMFAVGLRLDPTRIPSPLIDEPVPEFRLPGLLDGDPAFGHEDLVGQVSIVNVWGSWCGGCREEHGFLLNLAETGAIPVYGINWRDEKDNALAWLRRYGDPYTVSGFDYEGEVAIDWGVYGAPETFLISAEGRVVHKYIGPLSDAAWQKEFAPRIRQLMLASAPEAQ